MRSLYSFLSDVLGLEGGSAGELADVVVDPV